MKKMKIFFHVSIIMLLLMAACETNYSKGGQAGNYSAPEKCLCQPVLEEVDGLTIAYFHPIGSPCDDKAAVIMKSIKDFSEKNPALKLENVCMFGRYEAAGGVATYSSR